MKLFDELLDFTNGLEINEEYASLNAFRALSFSEKGEYKIAMELINIIIEKIQKNNLFISNLYAIKGDIYEKQDMITNAIDSYEKSLKVEESTIKNDVLTKLKEIKLLFNESTKKEN